jgi:hypothetical protein
MKLGPHREKVKKVLLDSFTTKAMLTQAARAWFELNLEEVSGDNLEDKTFYLIQWAEDHGKLRELARGAIEARPGVLDLVAVMQTVLAYLDVVAPRPWYESPTPYEACFLRRRRALLDRHDLRSGIKELATDEGARTFVVNGAAGSGRSFSLEVITFIAQNLGSFDVASVDLVDEGPGFTPDDFVTRVVTQIGRSVSLRSVPDTPHEQAQRRNVALAPWLTGELRAASAQTGRAHWIVVDGFDAATVNEATHDLIMRIAQKAETSESVLRVVLLACSQPLPPDIDSRALREEIGDVDRVVIEDFFNSFIAHTEIPAESGTVQRLTDGVLMLAPPREHPEWLRVVAQLVAGAAERLLGI